MSCCELAQVSVNRANCLEMNPQVGTFDFQHLLG